MHVYMLSTQFVNVDAYSYLPPTHCYVEGWGHTLGFKATGSLSVHTTVAVWNAHHAWELRAKPA